MKPKKYKVISIDYSEVPPKVEKICSTIWFNKAFYTALTFATKNSLTEDSFQKKLLNAEMAWSDRETYFDEQKEATDLHVVMIKKKKRKEKIKEEVDKAKEKEEKEM